jgi:hypothetical protein
MALSFLSNFCKAKKKREKTRIYEQSRGPGSNTQKNSLALWGEKHYAPVLYLTHSGRTKGLILSQLCLATALLLFILREEDDSSRNIWSVMWVCISCAHMHHGCVCVIDRYMCTSSWVCVDLGFRVQGFVCASCIMHGWFVVMMV